MKNLINILLIFSLMTFGAFAYLNNYKLEHVAKVIQEEAGAAEKKNKHPVPLSGKTRFAPMNINILSVSYIPLDYHGKVKIQMMYDWRNSNREILEHHIERMEKELVDILAESSRYHGYKDHLSSPSLRYQVIDNIKFYKPVTIDRNKHLNGVDVCDYVDNKDVKEIWLWRYHNKEHGPIESNMAMGMKVRKYWNFDVYGDVSNSFRENDLPICQNTYTVYEYNYGREIGMALENHTHQIEAVLDWIDNRDITAMNKWNTLLFWGNFVGSSSDHKIHNPGCGWTHYPPNGQKDYDWYSQKEVWSDCADWHPDGTGKKELVSCKTWSGDKTCPVDGGRGFKIWWMQNLPGKNNGLKYKGGTLRNWWEFTGDFDNAVLLEKSLLQESSTDKKYNNKVKNEQEKTVSMIYKWTDKKGITHYTNMPVGASKTE